MMLYLVLQISRSCRSSARERGMIALVGSFFLAVILASYLDRHRVASVLYLLLYGSVSLRSSPSR